MDWNVISGILNLILASGIIVTLVTLKAARKTADAKADQEASTEWHKLYDEQYKRNIDLNNKVDELNTKVNLISEENIHLRVKNETLEKENKSLKDLVEQNTADIKALQKLVNTLKSE